MLVSEVHQVFDMVSPVSPAEPKTKWWYPVWTLAEQLLMSMNSFPVCIEWLKMVCGTCQIDHEFDTHVPANWIRHQNGSVMADVGDPLELLEVYRNFHEKNAWHLCKTPTISELFDHDMQISAAGAILIQSSQIDCVLACCQKLRLCTLVRNLGCHCHGSNI